MNSTVLWHTFILGTRLDIDEAMLDFARVVAPKVAAEMVCSLIKSSFAVRVVVMFYCVVDMFADMSLVGDVADGGGRTACSCLDLCVSILGAIDRLRPLENIVSRTYSHYYLLL